MLLLRIASKNEREQGNMKPKQRMNLENKEKKLECLLNFIN